MKKTILLFVCTAILLVSLSGCAGSTEESIPFKDYDHTPTLLGKPDAQLLSQFDRYAKGLYQTDSLHNRVKPPFPTRNREVLMELLVPALEPNLNKLRLLPHDELISEIAAFNHRVYRALWGSDFYRWGGDIFDLDDPQPEGIGAEKMFGLDCSGFTTAPYEIAVHLGLLKAEQTVFASQGYRLFCERTGFVDGGALDGGSNRYRLDTRELDQLGRELFRIEKGSQPTEAQIKMLRGGDIVGRNGHFGIIIMLEGEPYFIESGGWVCHRVDGLPVHARNALEIFARNGYLTIRRCLEMND